MSWEAKKAAGNAAYTRGSLDEALKEYSDALACDDLSAKDRSVILCNRAQVYLRQKSYAAAVEDCTSSLTLAPDSVKAMFRRATALEMLGNIDDAIKDYREVLKMDPSVSDATTALQRLDRTFTKKPEPRREQRGPRLTREEMKALQEAEIGIKRVDRQMSQVWWCSRLRYHFDHSSRYVWSLT